MIKKLMLVAIAAGIGWYIFFHKSTVDKMMAVHEPIQVSEDSGIHEYTPRRSSIVEVTDLVVTGQMNIIYLHRESCARCRILYSNLKQILQYRPDVRVLKVSSTNDVGGYQLQYRGDNINIQFDPYVFIFDKDGNILGRDIKGDDDGRELVYSWMNAEIDRVNEKAREKWLAGQKAK